MKNKLDNALHFSGDMTKAQYDLGKYSLASLIDDCVNQFRRIAKRDRDIDIIVELNGIQDFIFDRDKMEIVFTNLLDNAVKYSFGGKDIYIRGALDGNEIRIEIEDFGMGIKEDEKGKIFERYYRAELKDRRRLIHGTGIGLSLSKKIVEDHKGRIEVESGPAGGIHHNIERIRAGESFITKFTVILPYVR